MNEGIVTLIGVLGTLSGILFAFLVSVNCGYINKNYTILYHKNRMVIFNENS